MLKSMTAFGRCALVTPLGRVTVEIQSVNRKHLEINTYLSRELASLDPKIKGWISAKVARGAVNVKINTVFDKESPVSVTPNIALAKQLKSAWDKIAQELGVEPSKGFSLSMLANEQGLLLYDEELRNEKEVEVILKQAIEEALQHLIAMKETEGKTLQADITRRLEGMNEALQRIAEKAPGATERFRNKLKERLQEVSTIGPELEERLLREVCMYAEKVDIAEEITRFHSHLKQFHALLTSDKEGTGKTLEFLVQELNREINTIGSKASDSEVTKSVVEVKSELEKIREQIQNVE